MRKWEEYRVERVRIIRSKRSRVGYCVVIVGEVFRDVGVCCLGYVLDFYGDRR